MKTNFTFKGWKHLFLFISVIAISGTMFAQTKHIVEVTKNVFTPANLKINAGDTVEWRNIDGYHNVNGNQTTYPMNPESFRNGGPASTNWTFSYVFTKSGKYDYQCDPHVGLGMVGTIEVAEAGSKKHIVEVTKNKFTPANLNINSGDTVEWRNIDGFHNVNGNQTTYPMNPESFRNGNPASTNWTFSYVFTKSGKYDYQCDPHVGLGMVGTIEVAGKEDDEKNTLTVNFSGMTPHVGQTLWLAVKDKDSGKEIERKSEIVSVSFSMQISGLEMDHSYHVDFFVDHNKNGGYDTPPADHAWRMELNDVMGDSELNFQHNTNFTDIMWKNKLTVHFMGMNPHVGQTMWLAVIEKASGMEVGRVKTTVEQDFMVHLSGIKTGMSYHVDFFSDHNKNGSYDAPPADHAWRMNLDDVRGDTTLNFSHNTSFTDIMWKNKLTVHFMGMNPHVGQNMWLAVIDKANGTEVGRVKTTVEQNFMVDVFGIKSGMSYNVDFFSDHNKNGSYDAPPADHAWRMNLDNVKGDTTLNFSHNTSFTDIQLSTGINQNLSSDKFRVYPNPTNGIVSIETADFSASKIDVRLYDITGKLRLFTEKSFSGKLELDLQHLNNGIYFIELKNGNIKQMLKLIKN